jgi:hypothetical protein
MATILHLPTTTRGETVRDVLEDRILDVIVQCKDLHHVLAVTALTLLIQQLADTACSALGISEKVQEELWDTGEDEPEVIP